MAFLFHGEVSGVEGRLAVGVPVPSENCVLLMPRARPLVPPSFLYKNQKDQGRLPVSFRAERSPLEADASFTSRSIIFAAVFPLLGGSLTRVLL